MRLGARVAGVLSFALVLILTALPAQAAPGVVTLSGTNPTGWLLMGQQRISVESISLANGRAIYAYSGPYQIIVAAAPGQPLTVGAYENAHGGVFMTEVPRPGLHISGNGRGCNRASGRFEIRDIAIHDNYLHRLDLLFEHHCEEGSHAEFGQLRLGYPPTDIGLAPTAIRWPQVYPTAPPRSEPVLVTNNTSVAAAVGPIEILGPGKDAFSVQPTCGAVIPAGSNCRLFPRFVPPSGGYFTAMLQFTVGGRIQQIPLAGTARFGTTQAHLVSDTGDPVGGGSGPLLLSPPNATVTAEAEFLRGSQFQVSRLVLRAEDAQGATYTAEFGSINDNFPLTRGRVGEPGGLYTFRVSGPDGTCADPHGAFRILQLSTDGVRVTRAAVEFVQSCTPGGPALRGVLAYWSDLTLPLVPVREPRPDDLLPPEPPRGFEPAPVPLLPIPPDPNIPPPDLLPDLTPPPALQDVQSIVLYGAVRFTWTTPDIPDLDYVLVRVAEGMVPPGPLDGWIAAYSRDPSAAVIVARGTTYAFSLFPVDTSGNIGPPSTAVVHGTSMMAAVTEPVVAPGGATTLVAEVRNVDGASMAGTPMALLARFAGDQQWTLVTTREADERGRIAVPVRVNRTMELMTFQTGLADASDSRSQVVTVRVKPHVLLRGPVAALRPGSRTTLVARSAPQTVGTTVHLQRLRAGSWVTEDTAVVDATGLAAFPVIAGPAGAASLYRTFIPPTTAFAAAVSNGVRIRSTG